MGLFLDFLRIWCSCSFERSVHFVFRTPISLLPSQVSHSFISLYVLSVLSTLIPRFRGQAPLIFFQGFCFFSLFLFFSSLKFFFVQVQGALLEGSEALAIIREEIYTELPRAWHRYCAHVPYLCVWSLARAFIRRVLPRSQKLPRMRSNIAIERLGRRMKGRERA